MRVKFVCEGHRVKVKVAAAKKVRNSYPRNVIGSDFGSIVGRTVKFACSMGLLFWIWWIEWCDRRLCYMTEKNTRDAFQGGLS